MTPRHPNLHRSGLTAATLVGLGVILSACQSLPRSFAAMSDEEIYAYNADKPVLQQVYCTNQQRTSSFIRKRRCMTIQQYINEREMAPMTLQVLNYGYNYNAGIGGRALD